MAYDVFISFKNTAPGGGLTVDRTIAERLHMKLRDEGLEVFFSEKDLSNAAFMDQIYQALDEADLLILVGTSVDYINSRWVKSEWSTFFGSIQSGRKENGHIITVLHGITTRDLPIQLEHFESFGANDLDNAVEFAFRTLGKVRKSEAAARIAEEQERQRKAAEEAAVLEMQKRMEAERQAAKEKAAAEKERIAAEKKRQKAIAAAERERQRRINAEQRAAEAQERSRKQAGQNRWLKVAAIVLCGILVFGGGLVWQQRQEEKIAEEKMQLEIERQEEENARQEEIARKKPEPFTEADRALAEIYDFAWVEDGFAITKYNGTGGDVVLPAEYNGNPVVEIGESAFRGRASIDSVVLPDGVTRIGESAFESCSNMTSIDIPDSIAEIGNRAFNNCYALESAELPQGLNSIGEYAFGSCRALTSISIPESTTHIGDGVFSYCVSLTAIDVDEGNTVFRSDSGVLYNAETSELIAYPAGSDETSYRIQEGTAIIGAGVFLGANKLGSINIPDSVTSIDDKAFDWDHSFGYDTIDITVTAPHEASYYGIYRYDRWYSYQFGERTVTWVVE